MGALVRAHGSLDAALAVQRTGALRLAELDDDGDRIARLRAEEEAAASALDDLAVRLTALRRAAAERLSAAVTDESSVPSRCPTPASRCRSPRGRRRHPVATT